MKEKRHISRPKTVYLWQEVNVSLQAISNFSWFMTGVNVPSPVTLIKSGFHCTTNATTTTRKQSDYKVEQSSFTLIALFRLEICLVMVVIGLMETRHKQELYNEFKNNTFHKIQRTNTKFLAVMSIRVFPYLTSTDNMVTARHLIPKEPKGLISFLNKIRSEPKLQSFNMNDILKGSWDFT